MGAGRRTQTITVHENAPWNPESKSFSARNLRVSDLRGVIFGCTHMTMEECLSKQLFGLPYLHTYVKNIGVGLPLFLFNYSDRKLHGIFEAASNGQMCLNSSAWTDGNSDRTPFPAQVRIRTRTQCEPLVEKEFKKIIEKNYYTNHHFWFELDNTQTRGLIALFKPSHSPVNSKLPPAASRGKEIFPALPPTKNIALSKKGPPPALPPTKNIALIKKGPPHTLQATTWKDVVSQNIKHINPSVNNLAALCDNGDSENDSPIKTSFTDDMESKESVSDWEDLVVDTLQNAGSSSGTWCEGGNPISEKQQYASKALENNESKLAAGYAQLKLNLSSNCCIHDDGIDCAPEDMYQDGEHVLGKFSILSNKEGLLSAPDLNHESAQDMESSRASYFNENAEYVEHTNASNLNHGNVEVIQLMKELKELKECAADLTNQKVESAREIQQLRNKLWYSERKIDLLEERIKKLEFKIDPSKPSPRSHSAHPSRSEGSRRSARSDALPPALAIG